MRVRIVLLTAWIIACPLYFVYASEGKTDDVEIVIDGIHYTSMREYRRQRLKAQISEVLTAESLNAFEDNELLAILKEIMSQKNQNLGNKHASEPQGSFSTHTIDEDIEFIKKDQPMDPSMLQDLLNKHLRSHQNATLIEIDPNKMKSVTISPQAPKN